MCCVCTFYYPCTHAGFLYQIMSHNFGENSEGKPESNLCHAVLPQCHRVTPWHSPLSAHGLGRKDLASRRTHRTTSDVSVELPSHVQSPPSIFCKIFCSGFLWFGQMPLTYSYLEFSEDCETNLKGGYDEGMMRVQRG